MISITKLTKKHESLKVFDEISLNIEYGEFVSIVGPSGCGKTTLLRCIAGLDLNYSGTIEIDGVSQTDYLKAGRVGFVPQKYSSFFWMTVYQNVELAFVHSSLSEQAINAQIDKLLKEVGLFEFRHFYPSQLSGGMQQRLAIARTLAQDATIIAFDEPFGALDFSLRSQLQLIMKSLSIDKKKTIIFVTHDISEAVFLSDKVIVFSGSANIQPIVLETKMKCETDVMIKYSKNFIDMQKKIETIMLNQGVD